MILRRGQPFVISLDPDCHSAGSGSFTGNQLRDSLLRWLSPSNPSTNHNIARKAHHDGTTQWFFQGRIFDRWKSSGSFLWVHVTVGLRHAMIPDYPLFLWPVQEKVLFGSPFFDSFRPCGDDIIISVPRLYKISWPCAMLGWPQWPISLDFRDVDKQKLCNFLPSLLVQLSA